MRDLNKITNVKIYADDIDYIREKYPGRMDVERIANLINEHNKLLKADLSRPAEITANVLRHLGADPKLINKLLEPI